MKRTMLAALLFCSFSAAAQLPQCNVNIGNELHLKDAEVSVYQEGTAKVLIDQDNNVFIDGEKLDLNSVQQSAVKAYRENINTYIPKAKDIAEQGMDVVNDSIDQVGEALDNSEAFENIKKSVNDYYAELESRYYNDEEWILKRNAIQDVMDNWKVEVQTAMKHFDSEFYASIFKVLSDKMSEAGSLNFTEMQQDIVKIKSDLQANLKEESKDLQKQAKAYCGNLQELATDEDKLQDQVPELKGYDVFVI